MNVLVVRAHPLQTPQSRSMLLTDAFLENYLSNREAKVTDLRLYEVAVPEIDLDMLTAWQALMGGEHFAHLSAQQ